MATPVRMATGSTASHTALCKAISEYMLWQGAYCVKNLGALGVRRGRPDFDCALKDPATKRAVFIAIEVKTGDGVLTFEQKQEKGRIEQCGGIFIEARSVDDVETRLVKEGLVLPGLC